MLWIIFPAHGASQVFPVILCTVPQKTRVIDHPLDFVRVPAADSRQLFRFQFLQFQVLPGKVNAQNGSDGSGNGLPLIRDLSALRNAADLSGNFSFISG